MADLDTPDHELRGTLEGVAVHVRFITRSHGSFRTRWTEIAVPYTPGTPDILFDIRPSHPIHDRAIRDGLMRDLTLGDEAFDAAFIVHSAPADIVRALFDAETRARMLALQPVEIRTLRNELVVERAERIEDTATLERMVRFAVYLAGRIEPAALVAAERTRHDPASARLRAMVSTDDVAHARAADIASLVSINTAREIAQKRRSRWTVAVFWLIVVVVMSLAFAAVFGLGRCSH